MVKLDVGERIKAELRKKEQADERIKKLRALQSEAERKEQERKVWLIGDAVLAAMENDANLNARITALMDATLVVKPDAKEDQREAQIKSVNRDRKRFGLCLMEEKDGNVP